MARTVLESDVRRMAEEQCLRFVRRGQDYWLLDTDAETVAAGGGADGSPLADIEAFLQEPVQKELGRAMAEATELGRRMDELSESPSQDDATRAAKSDQWGKLLEEHVRAVGRVDELMRLGEPRPDKH